jgi:hypothetical protein
MASAPKAYEPCPRKDSSVKLAVLMLAGSMLAGAASPQQPEVKPPSKKSEPRKTRPKATPGFSTAPFDSSVERLPPNYLGHSMIDVWTELNKRSSNFKKGEYETSAAWAARLQKLQGQPLTGSLTMLSQFAFRAYDVEDVYDADAKTLRLSLKSGEANYDQVYYDIFLWRTKTWQAGSFIGSNAFGVKRRVRAEKEQAYFTAFKAGWLGSTGVHKIKEVSVEQAKLIRSQIGGLIVGKLREPYVGQRADRSEATLDDPVQRSSNNFYVFFQPQAVWFYNLQSGEVYHRALI